jgi:hypothetical protein
MWASPAYHKQRCCGRLCLGTRHKVPATEPTLMIVVTLHVHIACCACVGCQLVSDCCHCQGGYPSLTKLVSMCVQWRAHLKGTQLMHSFNALCGSSVFLLPWLGSFQSVARAQWPLSMPMWIPIIDIHTAASCCVDVATRCLLATLWPAVGVPLFLCVLM